MQIPYTYWPAKEGGFIGYWNDYPDHVTEGETRRPAVHRQLSFFVCHRRRGAHL